MAKGCVLCGGSWQQRMLGLVCFAVVCKHTSQPRAHGVGRGAAAIAALQAQEAGPTSSGRSQSSESQLVLARLVEAKVGSRRASSVAREVVTEQETDQNITNNGFEVKILIANQPCTTTVGIVLELKLLSTPTILTFLVSIMSIRSIPPLHHLRSLPLLAMRTTHINKQYQFCPQEFQRKTLESKIRRTVPFLKAILVCSVG